MAAAAPVEEVSQEPYKVLPTPIKPLKEARTYEAIELKNEMKVMLAVNEKIHSFSETSLIILSIDVGYLHDPDNLIGLSGFAQTALCGSSKIQEYDAIFFTSITFLQPEHTVYTFHLDSGKLDEALKIISELFTEKEITMESVLREKANLLKKMEEYEIPGRFHFLTTTTSVPENPSRRFVSVEGLKQLTDTALLKEVQRFVSTHYYANRMRLMVKANGRISSVKNSIVKYMSKIPTNDYKMVPLPRLKDPVIITLFNKLYTLSGNYNEPSITFSFVFPPEVDFLSAKLIELIFTHEHKGSLAYYLKYYHLINSITASFEINSMFAMLLVSMDMTPEGCTQIEKIARATFEFIQLWHTDGIPDEFYNSFVQIQIFNFNENQISTNIMDMVTLMYTTSSDCWLTSTLIPTAYIKHKTENLLKCVQPEVCNIQIESRQPIVGASKSLFGIKFKREPIPPSYYAKENLNYTFTKPELNKFVPILFRPNQQAMEFPAKIVDLPQIEVWIKTESFIANRGAYYLHFAVLNDLNNLKNATCFELFVNMIKYHVCAQTYTASLTNLNHAWDISEHGFTVMMYGKHDKLEVLFKEIIKTIQNFNPREITKEFLSTITSNQRTEYLDTIENPEDLATEMRLKYVLRSFWTSLEKLKELNKAKMYSLVKFIESIQISYVQLYAEGCVNKEDVLNLCEYITHTLKIEGKGVYGPDHAVYEMPLHEEHSIILPNPLLQDVGITTHYYQIGKVTSYEKCLIDLITVYFRPVLHQIMGFKDHENFIKCTTNENFNVVGFSLTVVSDLKTYPLNDINNKLMLSLTGCLKSLKDLNKESLDKVKSYLKSLKAESFSHWDEIISGEYNFSRVIEEVRIIDNIKASDMFAYLLKYTSEFERKLDIRIIGKMDDSSLVGYRGVLKNERDELEVCLSGLNNIATKQSKFRIHKGSTPSELATKITEKHSKSQEKRQTCKTKTAANTILPNK